MTPPRAAALCGALAFGLYLATLAPTVGAGDSAELALAAGRGGIPHPPGYPLWVMAAWLFVRIPGLESLGDLGWRTNLFSAFLTALAVGGTAWLALRLRRNVTTALLTAGVVALAPSVWAQATVAEVHALNLLLMVAAGHAWLSAVRAPSRVTTALLGHVGSLLITFHPANIFLVPLVGCALHVVASRRRGDRAPLLCGVALGLLPLLWLPLRALSAPELDAFGAAHPDRLLAGWTREFYGPLRQDAGLSLERLSGQMSAALGFVGGLLGVPGLLLAGFGSAGILRGRRPVAFILGLTMLLVLFGPWLVLNATPDAAHRLSIEPTQAPVVLLLALLAGRGFSRLRALLRAARVWGAVRAQRALVASAAGAVAFLLLLPGSSQFTRQDRSDDLIARWYGEDLLRGLAPGATLFVEGDNELFLTAYLQAVDGLRPDVTLVHRRGYLVADPFGWRGVPRDEVTRERDRREADFVRGAEAPVYFAARPDWAGGRDFALRREGLAWRITTTERAAQSTAPAPDTWSQLHSEAWEIAPASLDYLHRKCLAGYYEARAEQLMAEGDAEGARAVWVAAAAVAFDFPERPALLAALGISDAEARP